MQRGKARLPALLVVLVGFPCRNRLGQGCKTRLDQRQLGLIGPVFQGNFHQRTGGCGKRDLGVTNRIGRPAKGKTMRLLNHLDPARVGARFIFPGKMDSAAHAKIHVTHHSKPVGKLFWFRDGLPDTLARGGQDHGSFDTIRKSHWLGLLSSEARCSCVLLYRQLSDCL